MGICGADDAGMHTFSGVFCDFNCKGIINEINPIDVSPYDVNPDQNYEKFGIFTDYFSFPSLTGACEISECMI